MLLDIKTLRAALAVPVIGAPMFLASGPELVIAQCRAQIIGALPALNARSTPILGQWLGSINRALVGGSAAAPFGVNLIVHRSNSRLEEDLEQCVEHRVPIIITSAGNPAAVVRAVHQYGGLVLHDVTTPTFARKALESGVNGLILVCAGAGGHAGVISPFAFAEEIRRDFDGTLVLGGAICSGRGVLAACNLGADFAYIGTHFLAATEARVEADYLAMLELSSAEDIVYTDRPSGIPGNYLRPSLERHHVDPTHPPICRANLDLGKDSGAGPAPWRDLWSAGQGVGAIKQHAAAAQIVQRLAEEYNRGIECSARAA